MDKIHNMKMTLGERIREQRCRMNLTQEELAEALCIKKSTISMYENDKVDIKTSVLFDLSRELNTSVTYLLGQDVRRHIVGGANRTLISVEIPLRLCRIGTCRKLSAG